MTLLTGGMQFAQLIRGSRAAANCLVIEGWNQGIRRILIGLVNYGNIKKKGNQPWI